MEHPSVLQPTGSCAPFQQGDVEEAQALLQEAYTLRKDEISDVAATSAGGRQAKARHAVFVLFMLYF